MADEKERGLVVYQSRDGQEIRLSFDIVRKFLVSGKSNLVTEQEMMLYMGMCKARGLNPFKRDCYLVKYTDGDPAATIVSIDYFRSRAKAQGDCLGWQSGIIVENGQGQIEYRKGAFLTEKETLLGGWFRGKPAAWTEDYEWSVSLKPYIKKTKEGGATRFWSEDNQAYMIAKVAESQGLRRLWPDEFQMLFTEEEIRDVTPEPLKIPQAIREKGDEAIPPAQEKSDSAVEDARQPPGGTSPVDEGIVTGGHQEPEPKPAQTSKKQSPEERKAAALKILEEATDEEYSALPQTWLTNAIRGLSQTDQLDVCKTWNKRKQMLILK
jgi:phage recombination protein Bet